jgi:hypothetical protein
MAKLVAVQILDRSIELAQDFESGGSDASFDNATIVGLARAGNQTALFHAIEKAGHIGIVRNHAVADAFAGKAFGLGTTQNAQDIILGAGETGFAVADKLLGFHAEMIGSFHEGNE